MRPHRSHRRPTPPCCSGYAGRSRHIASKQVSRAKANFSAAQSSRRPAEAASFLLSSVTDQTNVSKGAKDNSLKDKIMSLRDETSNHSVEGEQPKFPLRVVKLQHRLRSRKSPGIPYYDAGCRIRQQHKGSFRVGLSPPSIRPGHSPFTSVVVKSSLGSGCGERQTA